MATAGATALATLFISVALLIVVQTPLLVRAQSCHLNLQRDLDKKKEPLILTVKSGKPYGFALPDVVKDEGIITIASGKQIVLACTGSQNFQRTTRSQLAYLKCEKGSLRFEGEDVEVSSTTTGCTKSNAGSSLKVTSTSCGDKTASGVILELGFELTDTSYWFPLVELCHNVDNSITWYTVHTVYGHSLLGAVKNNDRKAFVRGSKKLYHKVNIDQVYTRANQEKTFEQILGSSVKELYINDKSFLSRGHLAPDGDFIYHSAQKMTYYFANVAPQCQSFNQRNWVALENTIRNLAIKYDDNLIVWTGTYGVMELANEQGDMQSIYLDPKKKLIPLPQVFWKVVQHPASKACTVAVGHNNVYLMSPPSPLCTTLEPRGWPNLKQVDKGYTYYCDLDSFREVVTYVPNIACQSILEFP